MPNDENKKLRQAWLCKLKRKDYCPKRNDRLCSEHFEEAHLKYKPWLLHSIGFTPGRQELLPGAIPTVFCYKRKADGEQDGSTALTKKKRGAYLKREHGRVLQDIFNTYSLSEGEPAAKSTRLETQTVLIPPGTLESDSVVANTPSLETTTDVEVDTHTSRSCQTECDSKSVGTMYKGQMRSKGTSTTQQQTADVGNQCMLLTPAPEDECSDGSDSDQEQETDEDDPDWTPDADESEDEDFDLQELVDSSPSTERKFMVFESCLRTLFAVCAVCSGACTVTLKQIMGTLVAVSSICKRTNDHTRVWYSQPVHNHMPVGNLMIAAATMFSGCSPIMALNLFRHLNVGIYSLKTYFNIQRSYLIPAIQRLWTTKQLAMILERKGNPLRLGGDARCCSPGHTAKYGSYSLMDLRTGEVLTTHLVQCNEVKNSVAMELEGLKRGLSFMEQHGLAVSELTTDRHVQVRKWLRMEKPNTKHWFDVWHIAKGVFRKLTASAKKPKCSAVGLWARSISNHLYWTAATSGGNADMAVQKWTSVARHVINIHDGHGDLFPRCQHGAIQKQWVEKGSRAQKTIEEVVLSSRLLKVVRQLSPAEQTSCLESFHNVVCFFASKHGHFFHPSMEARVILAALHFNENVAKDQARKKDGDLQWKVSYPKYKNGGAVVKPVKESVTYDYARQLMEIVWQMRQEFPSYEDCLVPETPVPPVTSTMEKISKTEAIAAHKSRFNTT